MVNWDDIDTLEELIAKLEEDEPEFRARMARGRAHLDQARRYLGWSEEEIARRRAARSAATEHVRSGG
jgi:hypothetical protein